MENSKLQAYLQWENKAESEKVNLDGYSFRALEKVAVNPVLNNQSCFAQDTTSNYREEQFNNRYYWADSIDLLKFLLRTEKEKKIDLIYIDPPYMTELDYHSTISIGTFAELQHIQREAFADRWPQGLNSYLDMLYPRLKLMREALAINGSIFVHVDWHVSHYVRVLLDEVFGRDNFVNEIAWCFGGGSRSRKYFHRKHDLIFWYSRSKEYTYNPQYRPYTKGTMQRGLTNVKGDRYKLHEEGALMQDWWTDVNKILSPTARENLKFPTQKPKELIKRLIACATHPGSLVADFFGGSGTLAEVCNEMGRKWILCDTSKLALQTSLYRLIRGGSPPFTIEVDNNFSTANDCAELVLKDPSILQEDQQNYLIDIGIKFYQPLNMKNVEPPQSFADLIEFWELDLDYNGEIFHSHFQVMREKNRFKDPLALDLLVRLTTIENRKIAIKVYDVFNNQSMGIVKLGNE